ncbi:Uncharacterized protein FKW44_004968, partial [Caligus rogercresseyi]
GLISPPPADKNSLAASIGKLWPPQDDADIEFLIEPGEEESGLPVSLKVHGLIISSRCEWFRRALGSGMKESIEKYNNL